MECKFCGTKIESKLNFIMVECFTIPYKNIVCDDKRKEIIENMKCDLNKIINENQDELLEVCSELCFNKLLYKEYLKKINNYKVSPDFYNEKKEYTINLLKDYKVELDK